MKARWRLIGSVSQPIHFIKLLVGLGLLALFQTACASPTEPGSLPLRSNDTASQETPSILLTTAAPQFGTVLAVTTQSEQPAVARTRPFPTLPEGIERIEVTPQSPITGEVPASLLESVLENLSSRQGIDVQSIEVVKAEATVWPDGSLGCPKPGEFYTQEPVNGYWIILEADATRYDYRASDRGHFFLCEGPLPPSLPDPNQ